MPLTSDNIKKVIHDSVHWYCNNDGLSLVEEDRGIVEIAVYVVTKTETTINEDEDPGHLL